MSEKLKPCPFCGGAATITEYLDRGIKWLEPFYVECKNCGTYKKDFPTKKDAIKDWNRRNVPEPQPVIPNKRIPGIGRCPTCKQELCIDDKDLHFCPTCGTHLITGSEDRPPGGEGR